MRRWASSPAGVPGGVRSGILRGILSSIAVLAITACAPLPLREFDDDDALIASRAKAAVANALVVSTTTLSGTHATSRRRIDLVERIWDTIVERYYDPAFQGADVKALRASSLADVAAVDNDAALYRVVTRDVDAIGDSHTTILTPREADEARTDSAVRFGIDYRLVEGRIVVEEVEPGSVGEERGIGPGMLLDAIDGIPIDAAFFGRALAADAKPLKSRPLADAQRELDARYLNAVHELLLPDEAAPVAHRLTFVRPDDTRWDVEVEPRFGVFPGRVSYRLLPSGVGLLRISAFEQSLAKAIAAYIDTARGEARGLIVDLRGNAGGDVNLFLWLVGRFIDQSIHVVDVVHRKTLIVRPEKLVARPAARPYDGPIAILVDASTASSAELTAHVLAEQRAAVIVGETTCGCVAGIRGDYVLPDGGALRVTELGFRSAHGRRMEADPLRPDLPITITLADARALRDPALQAAERALLERPPASTPAADSALAR